MTPQRMAALAKGNEIRLARAAERRRLKAMPREESRREVAALIAEPTEMWFTASLDYVLRMAARTGPAQISKWLRSTGLSPTKTLGSMTERQRRVLAGVVR